MEVILVDPAVEYCRQLKDSTDIVIGKMFDFWYGLFICLGYSKADASWSAMRETQYDFDKVDLTVNFDGPMF